MIEKKLKIAIVVQGRFYAFDLARELIRLGQEVIVFTNYPKFITEKSLIPKKNIRSFLLHGLLCRLSNRLQKIFKMQFDVLEPFLHWQFSSWAAKNLAKEEWDVIHVFSGVAEEVLKKMAGTKTLTILARASAHIQAQSDLLSDEEKRSGVPIDRPSKWIIQREEKEYRSVDLILMLSTFSKKTFLDRGFCDKRLPLLFLGTKMNSFRPSVEAIEKRSERILSKRRLRLLMVANFSFQKGALDFLKIADSLRDVFEFRFAGEIQPEAKKFIRADSNIEFLGKKAHHELREVYEEADIFIYTTIQDGAPAVLTEAQACGLPILSTTNCSASDVIQENLSGWILPIRDPNAFIEKLIWCNEHRFELSQMARNVYEKFQPKDWQIVAEDFLTICKTHHKNKRHEK